MATGMEVAEKAKSLLLMRTIPYQLGGEDPLGMDCQGLVEWTLRQLGIEADYRGTNDMWRNLVTTKGTIEEGVEALGEIPIGALIFIVSFDGEEPSRYQGDGQGNAWHVYIKISKEMLIHASASNLMVTTRTFADATIPNGGPSHYGLIDGIQYDANGQSGTQAIEEALPAWQPKYSRMLFRTGCMGNGVREIQSGLCMIGYSLDVDGRFGPETENAVMQFQEEHALEADGIVGPCTWKALIVAVQLQEVEE